MRSGFNIYLKAGYSVIELVIVMGIIVSLFGLAVIGFRGSKDREELVAAQRQLIGDLKSAQAKAVSGLDAAGYGVEYLDPASYRTIAYRYDLTGASCAAAGGSEDDSWPLDCPGGIGTCSVCKVPLETILLSEASPRVSFAGGTEFNVYFYRTPGSGQGILLLIGGTGPLPAGDAIQIVLEHGQTNDQLAVKIDTSGTIAQIEPMASPVPSAT